jgi:SsrA-binding protein
LRISLRRVGVKLHEADIALRQGNLRYRHVRSSSSNRVGVGVSPRATRRVAVLSWRAMVKGKDSGEKVVATNRKAFHDYFVEEKLEAGIVLKGTEVKSLREGRVNLRDSYAGVHNGEVFLHHCHISPYSHGNIMNHDPLRPRKLLLHRKEITKLIGRAQQRGLTLVPLRIYFSPRGQAKVELALAKGKKQYDRRESIKEREAGREVERVMKGSRRGG